jgi:hypothetical protein
MLRTPAYHEAILCFLTLHEERLKMLQTLFALTNWFNASPRRMLVLLVVIVTLLALSAALMPNAVALAGSATSGS